LPSQKDFDGCRFILADIDVTVRINAAQFRSVHVRRPPGARAERSRDRQGLHLIYPCQSASIAETPQHASKGIRRMTTACPPKNQTRVLLVDDDPTMVRLLARIIERSFGDTMVLSTLTNPAEALTALEKNLVDILVTDLEMPGVNGLELLRCAKRRNPLTQVLFITGQSSLDALRDALESGATDYLLKPLDQAQIVDLLGQAQRRVQRWLEALAGTFSARNGTSTRRGAHA
jgi:CheY-like chemotaxis protein